MIVMPANSTGWFFHSLARETGRLGHLFSPNAQRGPWPWFPFALDNGAFSCWDMRENKFDEEKWQSMEFDWKALLLWADTTGMPVRFCIIPDYIGNAQETIKKWEYYAPKVKEMGFPLAIAVQDGMTRDDVKALTPRPDVIAIGGTTEWKWETVEVWARAFPRVHLLRCNMPDKLDYLMQLGIESCDGTGWNRGDRRQTLGLEQWCKKHAAKGYLDQEMAQYVSRKTRKEQMAFA
jgi:hypothetical protein